MVLPMAMPAETISVSQSNGTSPWKGPVLLSLSGLLCLWGLLTLAASPSLLNPTHLLVQALAMVVGLTALATAERLPLPDRWPIGVLWGTLGLLVLVVLWLAWVDLGRTWYGRLLGWSTLLLFVICSLRASEDTRLWRRRVSMGLVWALLFVASFLLFGVRVIAVPLLALTVFLPFWKGRWRSGGLFAGAFTVFVALFVWLSPYRWNRVVHCLSATDPLGRDFASCQVRRTLGLAGWTGLAPQNIPFLPNGSTHYTLGLLGGRWGWLGLLLWFGIQAWLLGMAFRLAHRHRGRLEGDLLAALTFILILVTLLSASMALGLPTYGAALPLLGLDPGLTLLAFLALALGRRLDLSSPPGEGHPPLVTQLRDSL